MKIAGLHWRIRSTPTEEYFYTHYDGHFTVEVDDQDGDNSYWAVTHRDKGVIAKGEVPEMCVARRDAQSVAMDIAVAALRAIKAEDR
jgi:hypothetical protein